ncbi:MAG: hypothetical protein IJ631_00055, partial [Schwartzia sp.]|nr:hypothetical protein [Schwartzia sp. (in: firmicutes)]
YIHHHYFDAYHRPVYMEMELKDDKHTFPVGDALARLYACETHGVREVRFIGDVMGYEHLDRLVRECADGGMKAAVLLPGTVKEAWLKKIILAGADTFIVELDDNGFATMKLLSEMKCPASVRAIWRANKLRCDGLAETVAQAEEAGAAELVVAAPTPDQGDCALPDKLQLESLAAFIREYEKNHGEDEPDAKTMKLSVDSCFSPLRAFMGGEDPAQNANRGIERGCTAGRDHFCVLASGLVTPCKFLGMAEEYSSLGEYWENSQRLAELRRKNEPDGAKCAGCRYARRYLPCPAANPVSCPFEA